MKVVCIMSLVHSGSTVLDLVLGGHPRFTGLGELSAFLDPDFGHMNRLEMQRCSCGRTLNDCPFWGPFCAMYRDRTPASRRERYALLLAAFHGRFGADRVLVDSSKTLETVPAWAEVVGRDQVRALHLVRDVRSWTIAMIDLNRRLGEPRAGDRIARSGWRGPLEMARRSALNRFRAWQQGNLGIERVLASSGVRSLRLGYEEMCLAPQRVIGDLCRFLDCEPVPAMLALARSGSHIVLGNRMKNDAAKRRGILHDDGWRSRREWRLPALLFRRIMKNNSRLVYGGAATSKKGGAPPIIVG